LTRRHAIGGVVVLALAAIGYVAWRSRQSDDERAVRARLEALRTEINTSTTDGLGTIAHAAQIGGYFTDDVTIELGEGSPPINGRDTLMGTAARLQPRTAAFRLELDDINVELMPGTDAADVLLTASFVRRSLSTGEESRDAREFSLVCRKGAGTWRIARVTAIDTLR
jgi:hypothetical protein